MHTHLSPKTHLWKRRRGGRIRAKTPLLLLFSTRLRRPSPLFYLLTATPFCPYLEREGEICGEKNKKVGRRCLAYYTHTARHPFPSPLSLPTAVSPFLLPHSPHPTHEAKKSQRVVVVMMRDPLCSLGNHCYDSGLSHSGLISLACAQKG